MKASVYLATSFDGYIARLDGSIDWLNKASELVPEGEDCGFVDFLSSVDHLIMGRKTYEQVLSFGEWPYGTTPMTVLSSNSVDIPSHLSATVTSSSEQPTTLYRRLASEGVQHVYVDGGKTVQGFLAESLIDEVTITTIPIALGEGIPLFPTTAGDLQLSHLKTTIYDFGFVKTSYRVEKD